MSSRHKRKGESKFIMLERYVFMSPAYRNLTPVERAAYAEFKWVFDGKNNGAIVLSCRDLAEAIGTSKDTASRAIQSLCEHGFIELVKRGSFNCKVKLASTWRLAEYSCDLTGDLPTKQFMKWKKQNSVSPEGQNVSSQGQQSRKQGGI